MHLRVWHSTAAYQVEKKNIIWPWRPIILNIQPTGTADGARMERTLNVCGVGLENCIVTIFGLVVSLLTKRPFNC